MGEDVKMSDEYEVTGNGDDTVADNNRIMDWEMGLPTGESLTPLSQSLIPRELASILGISPQQSRTIQEVNHASQATLSALRNGSSGPYASSSKNSSNSFKTAVAAEEEDRLGSSCVGSDSMKQKKSDGGGGGASGVTFEEEDSETEDPSAGKLKRRRLVWTPPLQKRFQEVVAHLGIKNAVPKTIMQLMNVEGLTRENVASHLQKYRLYLKRMQGLTTEDLSSDQLFSSTPVPPQCLHDAVKVNGSGEVGVPISMPCGVPMPFYGHMGMQGYHTPLLTGHPHHHHPGTGKGNTD